MSQPNPKSEKEEALYQLHLDAGMEDGGKNRHGEQQWIGTDRQWERYEMYESKFLDEWYAKHPVGEEDIYQGD